MKPRKEISWWEPHWSFRPKLEKEFAPFRNPWLWVRLELVGVALVGFLFWLAWRFPEIEWPKSRLIAGALLGPILLLGAPMLLLWWLPPFIAVSRKGVMVMQGKHAQWYLAEKVRVVQLLLQVPDHPLLRVSTNAVTGTYGIAAKVSVADLEALIQEAVPGAKCERVTT